MIWLILLAVLAFVAIWWLGAAGSGRRAPNRLNNQGLPRGVTRDDHRHNDEE